MSNREFDWARSEVGTLERFLSELTEDDVIERVQLEQRLERARKRLAELEARPQPKGLPITFRGQPVEGTRSIDASFATQALKAFVEATDTVAASLVSDELKGRGRLPGVGGRSLRIVDTAVGSFGFELELPPPTEEEAQASLPLEGEEADPYAQAITTTLRLLDEASTSDEEAVSDLVAEIHPRAARKVAAFAKVLADHHALVAMTFEGRRVQFDDEAQVRRVVESLKDEDIDQEDETHEGTLTGILPHSRKFEAQLKSGALIEGRIDRSLSEIGEFKKRWENVKAELSFRVVRVRANRRYVLTGAASIDEGSP